MRKISFSNHLKMNDACTIEDVGPRSSTTEQLFGDFNKVAAGRDVADGLENHLIEERNSYEGMLMEPSSVVLYSSRAQFITALWATLQNENALLKLLRRFSFSGKRDGKEWDEEFDKLIRLRENLVAKYTRLLNCFVDALKHSVVDDATFYQYVYDFAVVENTIKSEWMFTEMLQHMDGKLSIIVKKGFQDDDDSSLFTAIRNIMAGFNSTLYNQQKPGNRSEPIGQCQVDICQQQDAPQSQPCFDQANARVDVVPVHANVPDNSAVSNHCYVEYREPKSIDSRGTEASSRASTPGKGRHVVETDDDYGAPRKKTRITKADKEKLRQTDEWMMRKKAQDRINSQNTLRKKKIELQKLADWIHSLQKLLDRKKRENESAEKLISTLISSGELREHREKAKKVAERGTKFISEVVQTKKRLFDKLFADRVPTRAEFILEAEHNKNDEEKMLEQLRRVPKKGKKKEGDRTWIEIAEKLNELLNNQTSIRPVKKKLIDICRMLERDDCDMSRTLPSQKNRSKNDVDLYSNVLEAARLELALEEEFILQKSLEALMARFGVRLDDDRVEPIPQIRRVENDHAVAET
ncbi:unnamed protein product [Caenorhabditis sp. 36 PRJEB53466]|nr:unnamed protein product [Caenorhabditis sp. 36 PRJEB53466]